MPRLDATSSGPGRAGASARLRRRLLADRAAAWGIAAGGISVVAAILLIFIFVGREALPLVRGAQLAAPVRVAPAAADILLAGTDSYQDLAWRLGRDGRLHVSDRVRGGGQVLALALDSLESLSAVALDGGSRAERFLAGTSRGRLFTCRLLVSRVLEGELPYSEAQLLQEEIPLPADSATGQPVERLAWAHGESVDLVLWSAGGRLCALRNEDEGGWLPMATSGLAPRPVALAVSPSAGRAAVAGPGGGLAIVEAEGSVLEPAWQAPGGLAGIRALAFLTGSGRLVAGDSLGRLSTWLQNRNEEGRVTWTAGPDLPGGAAPVDLLVPSPRDRSLLSLDHAGQLRLHYGTTGRRLLEASTGAAQAASFSPRGDALVLDGRRGLSVARLDNPHPELSWRALFGRLTYEGYQEPLAIWQSSGGSDDFEGKFSLLPILFGTLKGTLFAMVVSVPLALLGAIYVSQFAPTWLARLIKPAIEIMAALPSVIVGFLAGLVFAPYLEQHLTAVLAFVAALVLLILLMVPVWQRLPGHVLGPKGLPQLGMGAVLVLAALVLAFSTAPWLDQHLFGGGLIAWLGEKGGVVYDQRNSLVVGFALGFAVIPIIFTMAEDALSNVPDSLVSASLALGASRWTTVARVVLPGAAAGVFAAIMIGLGRAIGETMIVLMATGNTPLMDLSPFNGFRSLSACIAVEIPEAPVGGTLYRLLFLMALLLFAFTFLINTAASWIGERLRKQHGRI